MMASHAPAKVKWESRLPTKKRKWEPSHLHQILMWQTLSSCVFLKQSFTIDYHYLKKKL